MIDQYTYVLSWSPEDDSYIATVLEFPILITDGDTYEKALAEIRNLVEDVCEDLIYENEAIPEPLFYKKVRTLLR